MSINDIKLNPQLLSELYEKSLIESSGSKTREEPQLKFLGDNKKNVLIVVKNNLLPFLSDNDLQFLTTILNACKLSLADVAIINLENTGEIQFENVVLKLKSSSVLLFDVTPSDINLPINFPHFQVQHFNNHTYLYSPSFTELEQDKKLKSALWQSLKNLFKI